jgi:hypothetical protein
MIMGLGSNGCFVTGTPFTNGGNDFGFDNSVGHLRSDSAELLVYDGMCTISGASVLYYRSIEIAPTLPEKS